jgi:proteasome lid subunit RPN8/RPN11
MIDRFELGPSLAEQIAAHARECFPEEACGIIAGACEKGMMLYRGHNISPTPRVAFELDPDTLARQLDFELAGMAMTAIYHSHPIGPETPSCTDVSRTSEGYPESAILICSLADMSNPVLRAFRIERGWAREIALVQGREIAALTNPPQVARLCTKENGP